jgi:molecular chaperone DnaK
MAQEQQEALKTLIEQLKMAVNGNDKAAIEMRQKALQDAYSQLMQAQQSPNQGNTEDVQAANDANSDDDIIDADFEEVSNG